MKNLKKLKNKSLDIFFSNPFIFDILFASVITFITYILDYNKIINISSIINIDKIASQVSSSCITISGFVLTILTIVVSFKNSSEAKKNNIDRNQSESNRSSKVQLFFTSDLYFKTVKILQQSVTGLVLIFALFLFIVLFDKMICHNFEFYFVILGITNAVLIFLRCILTLKLIIRLQIDNDKISGDIND